MTMTAKYSSSKPKSYSDMHEDITILADQFSRLSLSDRRNCTPTPVTSSNIFFQGFCKVSLTMNASNINTHFIRKKIDLNDFNLSPIPKIKNIEKNIKKVNDAGDSAKSYRSQKQVETNEVLVHSESKEDILKYFAVALPDESQPPSDSSSLIFNELKLALAAIKSYKCGRVREFESKEAALDFVSKPLEKVVVEVAISEDDSNLKSPTCQELCQLRKFIEGGNEKNFVQRIWQNPKMLVGKSDTPSVLHEGIRINALHVAAKSNKPYICQLILDAIENPKFLKQIYPSESESSCRTRMLHLLDLYLNTPDKKTGDTPLHYASKFGCVDCVKVILSHPLCVHDRKNIDGLTPKEIICSRAHSHSDTLLGDMNEVFRGLFYVTIFRSLNNEILPKVGRPCMLKDFYQLLCDINKKSDSLLSLKAFAGPMSPDIAELYYSLLKNPSLQISKNSSELRLLSQIRFTDREKGLERFGRRLAKDLKVEWREYFSFLDIFIDLCSEEGLSTLESYLRNQNRRLSFNSSCDREEQSIYLVHKYPSQVNPLSHLVNLNLEREKEIDDDKEDIFITPPSSPVKNEYLTPPSSPKSMRKFKVKDIFLQGSKLTKEDVDVLLAIGDSLTNEYPFVLTWKDRVEYELLSSAGNLSCTNSFNLLTSLAIPSIHIDEKICTPRKTLLNT